MPLLPAQLHDTPTLTRLLSLAFGTPPDKVQEWLTNSGLHNFRVYSDNSNTPLACCLRIPMGHYFGHQSVKAVGVAGVAVAPEARGRGIASAMTAALLQEIRADGFPLSSLYPATLPLYRRGGYEQAGHWCEHRIALGRMELDSSLPESPACRVRAYDAASDLDAIKATYAHFAANMNGYLDRGDYVWGRVFHPRAGQATGFVLEGADGIEGYTFLRQERLLSLRNDVYLTDIAWTTPAAARALIDFLRGFQSIGEDLVFSGGPLHPLEHLLREQKQRVHRRELWMLRIVNVPAALEQRGFNHGIAAELVLHVDDDLLPENAHGWRVVVRDGRCRVSSQAITAAPAAAHLRLHARALASLYSGFLSAIQLRTLGRLQGDDAAVAAADCIFSSTAPSLPDIF